MKQTVYRIIDDFKNTPEWSLPHFEFPSQSAQLRSWPSRLSLKILSLNIWGLTIAPRLEERITALAENLAKNAEGFDVVALQEVWFAKEREVLRKAGLKGGLPYSYYWCCGLGIPLWPKQQGTGLFLLSRFPITETMYLRYPLNGKPYALAHGDYFATKGVALARLLTPAGRVNVLLTHLHSFYMKEGEHDEYLAHRVSQAFALAQFVNEVKAQIGTNLTVLVGDLNSSPEEITYKIVMRMARLTDCYAAVHPELSECGLPRSLEEELGGGEGEEGGEGHGHSARRRRPAEGEGRLPMDHIPHSMEELRQMLPRNMQEVKEMWNQMVLKHFTYGTMDNPFSAHDRAARLDFVFSSIRPGSGWSIASAHVYKQFIEPPEAHSATRTPISDHFGVCVEFLYSAPAASSASESPRASSLPASPLPDNSPARASTPEACGASSSPGSASSGGASESFQAALEAVDEGLSVLSKGTAEAQLRRRWHIFQAVTASITLALLDRTRALQLLLGERCGTALFLLCLVAGCVYVFAEVLLAALFVTGEITCLRELMQEVTLWKSARLAFPQLWTAEHPRPTLAHEGPDLRHSSVQLTLPAAPASKQAHGSVT